MIAPTRKIHRSSASAISAGRFAKSGVEAGHRSDVRAQGAFSTLREKKRKKKKKRAEDEREVRP
jgi:hypothetical protein